MQNHDYTETEPAADADLILRTRSGDAEAFGELWRRHYPSGMSVARSITSSIDPDDLVSEAYTRIYQAILKGGGPNGSFRAYLFTSIRNTAAAWGRSRRETAMDELETVADPDSTEQAADEALDRSLTAQAFRVLPTRWQEVLWYTEIEQMKPAEVAPLLGMKAGAVSQLAFRAREGLREAWIQAHLRSAEPGSECQWTIEHVGAYSRGNLSARDQKRLDQHIEDCARCMIVVAEAKDVSNRLALVLLPLVLGISGAAGYTATLQGGGAPIVAVAAMPSTVFDGGVVVGGATTGGGAAGSGGGASGGGASGGAFTGIGALVGAGSAALVVAGVVAAATIVPGLLNASPQTSLPSAGEAGSSSISSDVAPDSSLDTEEKFVLEIPEDAPETPDEVDSTPEVELPADSDAPANDVVAPPAPLAPGDGSGGDGDEGTTAPTDPTGPTNPTDPDNGGDPAPGGDGEGDGDDGTDPTDPTAPNAPVEIASTTMCLNDASETVVSVELIGFVGADLQPFIAGATGGTRLTTFDTEGSAIATLKPSFVQILANSSVEFRYTTPGTEFPRSTTLEELNVTVLTALVAPSCDPSDENNTEPAPTNTGGVPLEQQPAEEQPAEEAVISTEQPSADQPIEQPVPTTAPAPVAQSPSAGSEDPEEVDAAAATEGSIAAATPTEVPAPAE